MRFAVLILIALSCPIVYQMHKLECLVTSCDSSR